MITGAFNMKLLLKLLFGNGTRSVQTINFSTNVIWFVLLTLPLFDILPVDVPEKLFTQGFYPHILIGLAISFAVIGFSSEKDKRQLFKVAGLIFGSLTQAIIASTYISAYPPFEPMLIVCSLLSTWFLLAIMYIAFVEGMDGKLSTD